MGARRRPATSRSVGHLRVHLRGRDRGVAEQLLHRPDVGAVVEQVGRARVAQHVRAQAVAEADPVAVLLHHQPRPCRRQPSARRSGTRPRRRRAAPSASARALGRPPVEPVLERPPSAAGRAARCAPSRPCRTRAAAPPSRSTSASDSPTSSEMRTPVPYSTSSMARSRRSTGSSPLTLSMSAVDLVLGRAPSAGSAGTRGVSTAAAGSRRASALVGQEAVQRAHGDRSLARPTTAPCRVLRRCADEGSDVAPRRPRRAACRARATT